MQLRPDWLTGLLESRFTMHRSWIEAIGDELNHIATGYTGHTWLDVRSGGHRVLTLLQGDWGIDVCTTEPAARILRVRGRRNQSALTGWRFWLFSHSTADVTDLRTGEHLGMLVVRTSLVPVTRARVDIHDAQGIPLGRVIQDGAWWLRGWLPLRYGRWRLVTASGVRCGYLFQPFRPLARQFEADISRSLELVEPRLTLCAVALAALGGT
jgi:hypothetical protein